MHSESHLLRRSALAAAACTVIAGTALPSWAQNAPLPGAIFTAKAPATAGGPCTTVNFNIYDDKASVYLNGGPKVNGPGLLPLTNYYVRVTDPSGATVLGTSVLNSALSSTPVATDAAGKFVACYRLIDIVSSSPGVPGFADTPNNGGEYKVWVSTQSDFPNPQTKIDNFKVGTGGGIVDGNSSITIRKFYDANANGQFDAGEPYISGWKVDLLGYTPTSTPTTYTSLLFGDYVVEEYTPIQTNWYATSMSLYFPPPLAPVPLPNASSGPLILNSGTVNLNPTNTDAVVDFGNVCTGAGGGFTLGYWSNKNGQQDITARGIAATMGFLSGLNLKKPDGSDFDPASLAALRTWLLNGNAVNMAYMLSVQLAAMELNVFSGKVNGASMVYAPGTNAANSVGFASVAALKTEANAALGNNSLTFAYNNVPVAGVFPRTYQEYLKNALDNANNNRTFVQATPCTFSFNNPVPAAP